MKVFILFSLKLILLATSLANGAPLREGPGRSGGGNGVFGPESGELLDAQESANKIRIQNWNQEIPAYGRVQKRLLKFPDLTAYILDVLQTKPWYWTNTPINIHSCLNATIEGGNKDLKTVACQWQDRGVISKPLFNALSASAQEQLLIHEGLVHHMVQALNTWDQNLPKSQVDQRQAEIERGIHGLSTQIMKGQFQKISEINLQLRELGLPLIVTEKDKKDLAESTRGATPADVYVGAREKTELMKKRFSSGKAPALKDLRRLYGDRACFEQKDGYNIPGYYAAGYLKLDEMFPGAIFSVFPFREVTVSEKDLKDAFKNMIENSVSLMPMEISDGELTGMTEVNMPEILKQMFQGIQDPKMIEQAKEALRKQYPGLDLETPRRIRLRVRTLGAAEKEGQYVIFQREIFFNKGSGYQLSSEDYIAGLLKPYPRCLD